MLTITQIRRTVAACGLGIALLASVSGPAVAKPADAARQDVRTSSLAGTPAPAQDIRNPDRRDVGGGSQDPVYWSYENPVPPVPAQPAGQGTAPVVSDGTDWLPIALSLGGALVLAGAFAAHHRAGTRRRHAAA